MTLVCGGQTASTGAVAGTVTDPTGAAVARVEVAIISETTGAKRIAVTGTDGVYRFPLLPPSTYSVQASATGFKVAVRSGLQVRVTETTGLDIKLEIGAQAEQVTVGTEPELAQTDSNALGRVTDERSVKNLPLVSRNFTQIIGLSPGVNVGVTDASQLGLGYGGMSNYTNEDLSVNGARSNDNNFQMDGVTANDIAAINFTSGGIAIPNPDTIAEFKVQTGQYDASYGRNAGANVNVVTKSGSNAFHGDAYEFFRNEALNANSFFFNADGVPRGVLRQNQFGATLGGPIKQDKLLFFGSYQGTRQLNGVASGCSSSFAGPPLTNDRSAAALGAIFGGQTGVLGGVAVAPDGSNINPVTLNLLNLKLPNGSYVVPTPQAIVNGEGEYAFSEPCAFTENQFMTNVDFLKSSKSKFAAKFFFANQNFTFTIPPGWAAPGVPGSPAPVTSGYRNFALTHDYVFNPHVLNQTEFGFHRTSVYFNQLSAFNFPEIGSEVIPQSKDLALVVLGSTEMIGTPSSAVSRLASNVYTLQDTLTYLHGSHNLRLGSGVTWTNFNFDWLEVSDTIFLSTVDLLLGQSAAQNGSLYSNIYESDDVPGQTNRNYFVRNPWAYAQDDFRVNSRLTFNLGLRYERLGYFADKDGRNASFGFGLANPNPPASGSQQGYVVASNFPGTLPAGSVRLNNEWAIDGDGQNTFSPRIGFAWQILPRSNVLVLRGGYGIYYSTLTGESATQNAFVPPWAIERFISGTPNAGATFAAPYGQLLSPSDFPIFPAYSPSTQLSTRYPALNMRPPVTEQYNLNLQKQLASSYLLEVGYVGARGRHLIEMVSQNQAEWATASDPIHGQTTNTLANVMLRVPIEGFSPNGLQAVETEGASWYNALQVSLTKRFSRGLQFLASYTYSRLLDTEGGETNFAALSNTSLPGNQNDLSYGPSSTIRPHRVVVSFVYELPRLAREGLGAALLNNWSLSGVMTLQSGHPLTITSVNGNNIFGINSDHGEFAPGCTKKQLETPGTVNSKLNDYFNEGCIGTYPVIGSDGIGTGFGNMGSGLVNGPDQRDFDLALIKRIPLRWFDRESSWEFRTEFFNAFNTPQFADPDTSISDGRAFGVVSATLANPRIIQFALKYNF